MGGGLAGVICCEPHIGNDMVNAILRIGRRQIRFGNDQTCQEVSVGRWYIVACQATRQNRFNLSPRLGIRG